VLAADPELQAGLGAPALLDRDLHQPAEPPPSMVSTGDTVNTHLSR